MADSSQKFIARNRAPRVQIEYDVELYGAEKKVQLPFVMGVMSDLAGKSEVAQPAVADRKFLEIDIDNFDDRMRAIAPRAAFNVPNTLTGEGSMPIDLTFEKMSDFEPSAIAARVEPLRPLLETRQQLSNLMTYMDGKAGAEALIEKVLADPALLGALARSELRQSDAHTNALDVLRAVELPAEEPEESESALDSLRAAEVPVQPQEDNGTATLDALRAVDIEETPQEDQTAALDALRNAAVVETDETDNTGAALDALRNAEVVEVPQEDEASAALDVLRNVKVAEASEADSSAAALDALRAVDVPSDASDDSGAALDALRAVEISGELQDNPDVALDALRAQDIPEETVDESANALDALRAVEVHDEVADSAQETALDALKATKVDAPTEPDDHGQALDALRSVEVEADDLAASSTQSALDTLGMADIQEPEIQDDTNAALDALRDIEIPDAPAQDDSAAVLAAMPTAEMPEEDAGASAAVLANLDPVAVAEPEETAAAVLAGLETIEDEAPVVDAVAATLAGLDAPAEAEHEESAADILAGLDMIEDVEEKDDVTATLAGLEAPKEAAVIDEAASVLAGLEVTEEVDEADELAATLAGLEIIPEDIVAEETAEDILAGIEIAVTAEPIDTSDSILAGLEAPEEVEEVDGIDSALAGIPTVEDTEEVDDITDALAGLEAPLEQDPEDDTADILAGLDAVAETVEIDNLDDLLAGIEAPPEAGAKADDLADVLGGLDAPKEPEALDSIEDILEGLDVPQDSTGPQEDNIAATLEGLEAPEEVELTDDVANTLAGLEAAPALPVDDSADDILAGLEPVALEQEDNDLEATLAGLDMPASANEDEGLDDILASLEPAETVESQSTADILGDLDVSGDDAIDDLDDLLADLGGPEPGEDDLGELLADLGGEPESASDAPGDDLDALIGTLDGENDANLAPEEFIGPDIIPEDGLDDLLAGLGEDDAPEQQDHAETPANDSADSETDDDLDALLSGLEADDDVDDLLAGLEDDTSEQEDSAADDLDGLLARLDEDEKPETPASEDDLDTLLAGLDDMDETDTSDDEMDALLSELEDDTDSAAPSDTTAKLSEEPELAYGQMSADRPDPQRLERKRFRIAIMGDFTGRSARGEMEIGDALANRKPILLDPDTVEDVIEGFGTTLVLPIGKDGAGVEIKLGGLDDLHPDELYENVEIFSALKGLKSQLSHGGTAENAGKSLIAWGEAHGRAVAPPRAVSGGNTVRADLKLSDFQKLIGDTGRTLAQPSPVDDLIARIVGPHIRKLPDANATAMAQAVDDALSGAMRMVLHHPEFQSVESQWRGLDLIARSIETDDTLEVMLYDISAEEIAADLTQADDLSQSGFVRLLTEGPMDEEFGRGAYSALMGMYTFEETPPHAQLLGRIARVAAHVDAPFFAAITPGFIETAKQDRHPLVAAEWDTLRAMPEAGHLALATPRFLMRRPYGAKTEPIYEFEFEEFTQSAGLSGMLWANPVVLVTILLAKSFRENGPSLGLGQIMSLGDMPYHYVLDRYGDQVALPCTERNLTLDKIETVLGRGYLPVVSIKGRDEVRLASFQSLAGGEILGPWSGVARPLPSPPKPPKAIAEGGTNEEEDAATDDDDLDDLLSGFDLDADDNDEDIDNDDDMDAELAALLADL